MSGQPKKVPITVPMPDGKSFTFFVFRCDDEHGWPDDDVIYNDGLHEMTEEEWSIYDRQVRESDGFDVDPLFGVYALGIIQPLGIDQSPETLHRCINLAIEEYCKKHDGKKLKLKEAVKWNVQIVCPCDYYITFTAEDEETREVETYQALVVGRIPEEETYVEMVRVKPKKRLPDASSPPEESSSKKLCP